MKRILKRKTFDIPEAVRNNELIPDFLSTTQTYKITTTNENGKDHEFCGTISDVKITDDSTDMVLTLSPLWYDQGPINGYVVVKASEITAMEQQHIKYSSIRGKGSTPRTVLYDFVLRMDNYDATISKQDFVKILYITDMDAEDSRSILFGYVTAVDDEAEIITVSAITGFHGLFEFVTHEIPLANIYAIFNARVTIEPFERRPRNKKPSDSTTVVDSSIESEEPTVLDPAATLVTDEFWERVEEAIDLEPVEEDGNIESE